MDEEFVYVEDFVWFNLYPDWQSIPHPNSTLENREDTAAELAKTYCQALESAIASFLSKWTEKYLWQRDRLALTLSSLRNDNSKTFLTGRVCIGEAIDDEWFITFLLFEVSKAYPDLVISYATFYSGCRLIICSIFDRDGDFLLIEAAEALPDWLEPNVSKNRIFIYRGELHIVSPEDQPKPTLLAALSTIRTKAKKTRASTAVQNILERKLARYCNGSLQDLHRAAVRLPLEAVHILHHQPTLVGPLVEAIHHRQPADASAFAKTKTAASMVTTTISFSRLQFAMLAGERLEAPAWYPMPAEDSPDYTRAELGLKLAFAIELIRRRAGDFDKGSCAFSIDDQGRTRYAHMLEAINGINTKTQMHSCLAHACDKARIELALQTDLADASVYINNEPEDHTEWMEVDEDQLDSFFTRADNPMLDDKAMEEIAELMTREFEEAGVKTKKLADRNQRNGAQGAFDVESDESVDDADDSERESCKEEEEEENTETEEFLEYEILETIKHDPDLLMRMLECATEFGFEKEELLRKVQQLAAAVELGKDPFGGRKKHERRLGMSAEDLKAALEADEEAEMKRVVRESENSEAIHDPDHELSSDEGEADLPYGESIEEFQQRHKAEMVVHDAAEIGRLAGNMSSLDFDAE